MALLEPELNERLRKAATALAGPPELVASRSALAAIAIEKEVLRLERKYNGGEPFPDYAKGR